MRLSYLESVAVMEFQTTEAYSNLGLTNAEYNTNKQSNEEKLKLIERMKPSSLMNLEQRNST
jgi:hypothetical protein